MDYEVVIGLEVHAELSTKSKIFCSCTTAFGGDVNTHTCPVCVGMPGTLPVLNKCVVEYAIKAGLSTNCSISPISNQDRKNYFYPDLPKAYQISQYDLPICTNGYIDILVDDIAKRIGITRIHIEEDAGKLMHDEFDTGSLIDYNRGGVPLIEIVSEPDMRNSKEVKAFLENLKAILEYLEVSDCKMQEGSLRADVNLSVRPITQKEFGTRTEMKNLNSFKSIIRAIEAEAKRQIAELESKRVIIQETRRWDDNKGVSYSMRSKEDSHDYRYFREPDLMPMVISDEWISEIKSTLPELPELRRKRYINDFSLPEYDAYILTSSKYLANFFDDAIKNTKTSNAKAVSNWIMGDLMKILNEKGLEPDAIPFKGKDLAKMIDLIDTGTISGTIAKKVFEKMFETSKDPEQIVKESGFSMVSDEGELLNIVKKVIENNPQSVEDYKAGKEKALGFLVGQAMKESKGKGNPQILNKLLKDCLTI